MQIVILHGRLGADPEYKNASGTEILKLRVATDEQVKKGEKWEKHTEWHRCTLFGARAGALSGKLTTGSGVVIRGKLRTTSYEKEGQKHYSTEIIVDDLDFAAGSKGASGGEHAPHAPDGATSAPPAPSNGRPPPRAPQAGPPQIPAKPPHPPEQIPDGHGFVFNKDINDYQSRPELNLPKGCVVNNAGQPLDTSGQPMRGGAPF